MRLFYLLTILFLNFAAQAQEITPAEKKLLDSMMAADPLLNLLTEEKKNEIDISIGMSNGIFSAQNPAINATGSTNLLVVTPAVFFNFKSGIMIGATSFIAFGEGKSDAYQTGLSIGYNYEKKNWNAMVNYTRNLANFKQYNGKATYANEIFADLTNFKNWLAFGASIGFANGRYNSVGPLTIPANTPILNPTPFARVVQDSVRAKTSYFSLTPYVEHAFEFEKVLGKKDYLSLTPRLMLNMGSDKLTETHTNVNYERFLKTRFAANRGLSAKTREQANKFQMQSLGLNTSLIYGVGKFYVQPNLYLDYYLQATTDKAVTAFFNLTAGVTL